jgi:glycosyltransferase involved in cell wall biosynthesis
MALGVPIIATAIGSLPELIENGKEGLLSAPDDLSELRLALESIRTEPEIWGERKRASEEKVRLFSIERMIKNTAELLLHTV